MADWHIVPVTPLEPPFNSLHGAQALHSVREPRGTCRSVCSQPRLLGVRRNLGEARHALVHPGSGAPPPHARLDPPDHPAHEAHPPHSLPLSCAAAASLVAACERLPATRDVLHELCGRMQLGDRGEVRKSAQPAANARAALARAIRCGCGGTRLTAYARARRAADCSDTMARRARRARRRARRPRAAPCTRAALELARHSPRRALRIRQPEASRDGRRCHRPRREHHAQPCATEGGLQPCRRLQPHRADRHRLRRQHIAQPPSEALHKNRSVHGATENVCAKPPQS